MAKAHFFFQVTVCLFLISSQVEKLAAFAPKNNIFSPALKTFSSFKDSSTSTALLAKVTKKKNKKKSGGGTAAGIKGFGAPTSKSSNVETDRSKEARAFYDYLEKAQAGDNLKRCALGYFPLPNGISLRGVVAQIGRAHV